MRFNKAWDVEWVGDVFETPIPIDTIGWMTACVSANREKKYQLILRRKPTERSRKVEKFHWAVQVPMWAEHAGVLESEAHYSLLSLFPVIGVREDGSAYSKTSRDMESAEYYRWVFHDLMIGCAEQGCVFPDPESIHYE